jgi:hypothetical protein
VGVILPPALGTTYQKNNTKPTSMNHNKIIGLVFCIYYQKSKTDIISSGDIDGARILWGGFFSVKSFQKLITTA